MKKNLRNKKTNKSDVNSKNYEWFIKKADVSRYAGKWIAIEKQRIVASDAEISKLLEDVRQNWPDAAITKIPKRGQIMVL